MNNEKTVFSKSSHEESETSLFETTRSTHSISRRRHPIPGRLLPSALLLWLDPNIDESSENFRTNLSQLQQIVVDTHSFNDCDECVNFLTEIDGRKIFIIVPEDLTQQIIPFIHDRPLLDSIYILGENKNEVLPSSWTKVKGIFSQMNLLCESLKQSTLYNTENFIPMSFISSTNALSNVSLDQLDQTFMYTQLLKEILLELNYDNDLFMENMVEHCRKHPLSDNIDLESVDRFKQEYHLRSPVWWYTSESFLYSMTNRALRTQDIDTIIHMSFFLHDLHRNIEQLHSEQTKNLSTKSFTLYRGQGLSAVDFDRMRNTSGGLLSFNYFLSTSRDPQVALLFADSIQMNPDLISVIFQITIDPSMASIPFANLDNIGRFNETEQEILFSMHTVFRLGQIKCLDGNERFWQVDLTLTNDNDKELNAVLEHIRKETKAESHRLGKLLMKLGEYEKAREFYEALLNLAIDDAGKKYPYHQLALIKDHQGHYAEAITLYKNSLEIYQRTHSSDDHELAICYNNIALVYDHMSDHIQARQYWEQALEILQKSDTPDQFELATTYNNLGQVYQHLDHNSKALDCYEHCRTIYQRILPSYDPRLATCYNNIALFYHKTGKFAESLCLYEQSFEIYQKILPCKHPDLASIYNNIGGVYQSMGKYKNALMYFEKALQIHQEANSPYEPNLALCHNNIGMLYTMMGEYSKAITSYERALALYQEVLPSNHLYIASSHENLGTTYNLMSEYSKALMAYEKALKVYHASSSVTRLCLATFYVNMGTLSYNMGDYDKALSFYKEALEIRQANLPEDHPDLGISYNNIGNVYIRIKDYSKALASYEHALQIYRCTLSSDHPNLAVTYNSIGVVYGRLGEYRKGLVYHQKSLEIHEKTLSSNHPELVSCYSSFAFVYKNLREYTKALEYQAKALAILQTIRPPIHPDLAMVYNDIGSLYENTGDYSKACSFYQRTVDIAQQSLPSDHPKLQLYQQRLESARNSQ